ncbi:MAG TPA: GNAT family N-acetyltransferase [Longimicrobium sp.]|nr:GNAT family N-acetyltransferase [Longimicrobium sp.]
MSDSGVRVLDAADEAERREWLGMWEAWPQREVFAHPDYVALYAEEGAGSARCAVLRSGAASVLYPFVQRDLRVEKFWDPSVGPASDLISPYGYGGAYVWGDAPAELAARFWAGFDEWARREKVVSEFVRFSLFPEILLPYPGTREERLQNVVRSLDLDEERMWMDFEHKVRKNVKRAQRSGVTVELDPHGARLDDFLRIYQSTMDRREADSRYYFPRSYFERLQSGLPGQFMYFHALLGGEVVSTELVLASAENVYSFLGGTDPESFATRPNDLLKHEIIRWAAGEGKRRFVLGGGYQPDDGIYRYKLAFAPGGATPYRVGYRVLDPELYAALSRRRPGEPVPDAASGGYFPAYRA